MELTPEERQRIFEEEKARLDAQQELAKEKADADAKIKAAQTNKGCVGCLTVIGILLLLVFGTASPTGAVLTMLVGIVGLVLTTFGDLHMKADNPKAARMAIGIVAGLVMAEGIYGLVWTSSDEYRRQSERVERRSNQIRETEDAPPSVQKDIDNEYHRNGNTERRR